MTFAFQKIKRTLRPDRPKGSVEFRYEIERVREWSLMSDGHSIVVARWSQSNYSYIDTDLLPIPNSSETMTHFIPLGIKSIIEIPSFVTANDPEPEDDREARTSTS